MAYTKTNWVDEVLAGDERFEILDNAGAAVDAFADLENCQIALATAITTSGTPVNAANLNNIEEGIEDISTGAALSVKGVAGDAAGDVADIAAANDGEVLRRSSGTIGFGQVTADGITDGAISESKLASGAVTETKIASASVTPAKTSFFTGAAIYHGRIASDGSAVELPSGWSCSKLSTGKYRITHSLGTTDYTIVQSANQRFSLYANLAANTCEVWSLDGTGAYHDAAMHFILIPW